MEIENEKKIKDKFLPIGTVVKLINGKKNLMITGYCIIPTGDMYDKNGKVEVKDFTVFDYGATFYPEGFIRSDRMFAFNHEQIAEIVHMGYETEEQKITLLLNLL